MEVFEINTTQSNYPFIVLAEGILSAIGVLQRKKNVRNGDIISVQRIDTSDSDHVLVEDLIYAEERLKEKVRRELEPKLPHWQKMPDGAAGGGDRKCFLIRSSKGNYFTSSCIGGECYYLNLDDLEQLPGIINSNEG
jgi:hypothetical protein